MWLLLPLSLLVLSRLSEEVEEVNNSLGELHSSPEEVVEVAVAGAEAPPINRLMLREEIFGVAAGATPENDRLSILLEEG